jgi:hypothetical protein
MKVESFILVLVLMFQACTEVIHIDLNASDPQIVVEAHLAEKGKAEVRLHWSVNVEADNEFPPVEGARVMIEDEFGNGVSLSEVSPGRYMTATTGARAQMLYRLVISWNDNQITADDRMPRSVLMDSLTVRRFRFPFEGVGGRLDTVMLLEPVVWYKDPVEEKNQYRILEFRNDTLVSIALTDDQFNNGKVIGYSLFNFRNPLKPGDNLMVEFQAVSRPVYEYLFGFSGVNGGPLASSPSNPATNLTGTRLGYFSAHTVHRLGMTVPHIIP